MSDEVNFRLAEPVDAQAILALLVRLQRESDTFLVDSDLSELTAEMEADQIRLINQSHTNLMAIALNGTQPIGIVTVDGIDQDSGELGVAVLKHFQGYTIGTNLVELAIEWAVDYSMLSHLELTVFANNAPAVHIYEKLGFKRASTFSKHDQEAYKMILNIPEK
ncbi:GNAT family protein [Lentilactobacillus sp. TOM.63]|uniref:GNAT family N-acetyltransferase n=1 Tax=Lentilactobacillus TaxID=2767893 RepID=UPI001C25DA3B|nr:MULTISPECIES: GNAT family protein [Lentilactobacillus]MBU9789112.1 GNAT family N-acetyltransferase [Lentilactobacillus dabitei]MDM7516251.1 GNAT family protein [Lentilactobacillus sp. TOM.63]